MKIEKLPSGPCWIKKMYKGKMRTVVFDHNPTPKEAMQAMAIFLIVRRNQGIPFQPFVFNKKGRFL